MRRRTPPAAALALAWLALSHNAHAAFVAEYADPPGMGFNDTTSVKELAQNSGTTLGEQRRIAFEHALELWEKALPTRVPIRVRAAFDNTLPCSSEEAALGAGRAVRVRAAFPRAPRSDLFYVVALANHFSGEDLEPGEPDIEVTFNARIDGDCVLNSRWNYDLTPDGGPLDFISTALHELTHGLGVATRVSEQTGAANNGLTQFERLVFDRRLGRYWDQMTNAERMVSARSPWSVVWHGSAVRSAATDVLAKGATQLELWSQGATPAFEHHFSEAVRAQPVSETLAAKLVVGEWQGNCEPSQQWSNRIVMLQTAGPCADATVAVETARRAGARAVLWPASRDMLPPPPLVLRQNVPIPVLTLAAEVYTNLRNAVSSSVWNARLSVGIDRQPGRAGLGVLLNANTLGLSGISHWDPSVRKRPDENGLVGLLLEPAALDVAGFTLEDLTLAMVHDVGWGPAECGNAILEPGEACDDGNSNNDREPGSCRRDCRVARCGDGVVDPLETCDRGGAREWGNCPMNCGREVSIHPFIESQPLDAGFDEDPPDGDASVPLAPTNSVIPGDSGVADPLSPPQNVRTAQPSGGGCQVAAAHPEGWGWVLAAFAAIYRRRLSRLNMH